MLREVSGGLHRADEVSTAFEQGGTLGFSYWLEIDGRHQVKHSKHFVNEGYDPCRSFSDGKLRVDLFVVVVGQESVVPAGKSIQKVAIAEKFRFPSGACKSLSGSAWIDSAIDSQIWRKQTTDCKSMDGC